MVVDLTAFGTLCWIPLQFFGQLRRLLMSRATKVQTDALHGVDQEIDAEVAEDALKRASKKASKAVSVVSGLSAPQPASERKDRDADIHHRISKL